MAYNTGLYAPISKLLLELSNAGKATAKMIVLSNKVLISGTVYEYDFTAAVAPVVGDFLTQGNYYSMITQVAAGKLRVLDGTNINAGKGRAITYDGEESELTAYMQQAMSFIDRHTRQWFNARTFDDSRPVLLEGNNTECLFLQVPILEITSIRKQEGAEVLSPDSYQVFNGRSFPDDRRNPMIKLRKGDDDVLFISSGKFMRGVRLALTGVFGFLEEDGSTPPMVARATLKLALIYALKSLGEAAQSAADGDLGPIKREKTDLHEIEYFDARATTGKGTNEGTGLSGDDEIDDVIAAYKGPMIIGGTFPDIGIEAPVIASWSKDS